MSIAAIEPDKQVDFEIDFGGRGLPLASLVLEPVGAGTKVTWGLDSDLGFNPIARYFGMMMDGMIGPDYEKGLARLKAVAETPPPARPPTNRSSPHGRQSIPTWPGMAATRPSQSLMCG